MYKHELVDDITALADEYMDHAGIEMRNAALWGIAIAKLSKEDLADIKEMLGRWVEEKKAA